jgi:3'-phosphoadenosine 5'-phosphosulfate sulfotransferase (PAPS reductase)/FAD synthetase
MSYPATTPNLKSRWCTSEAKIDVAESQLRAREDLRGKRILYCSGERAEESANRATYSEREFSGDFIMATGEIKGLHGSHGRHVEVWRPLLRWCELDVWAIIRNHGIQAHPAYALGFSRLSCMTCIFGNKDQWASIRRLDPARFEQFAATEEALVERQEKDVEAGVPKAEKRLVTMKGKGVSITEFADKGEPFRAGNWSYAGAALSSRYEWPVAVHPSAWELPAGAFQEGSGPP